MLNLETEPTPKARPVTVSRNGRTWTFPPKKDKLAHDTLQSMIQLVIASTYPEHTPLKLTVIFWRTRPVSAPKTEAMPVRKPDLDNYIKSVLDALSGLAFPDDAQVTTIVAKKRWSTNGAGHIEFSLEEDSLDA